MRFFISLAVFAALAIAVGFLLAGRDTFDWAIALGTVRGGRCRRDVAAVDAPKPRQEASIVRNLRRCQ